MAYDKFYNFKRPDDMIIVDYINKFVRLNNQIKHFDKDTDDRYQNSKDSSRGGTSQYPRDGYGSSRDQYPRDGYRHNRNMSHRSCYYRLKENFDK